MTQSNIPAEARFQGGEIDAIYRFRAPNKDSDAREPVEVKLPAPTAAEIANLLQANLEGHDKLIKVRDLVMEAIHGIVISVGKVKVDADLEFSQDSVAGIADDLSLYTIANLPRAERNMVTNSDLAQFANLYKENAAAIVGVSQKAADTLAGFFSTHASFRRAIAQEGMPAAIQGRINAFVEGLSDEQINEHGATIEWINTRIEDTLKINIDPSEI